jgi:hypothetical protein
VIDQGTLRRLARCYVVVGLAVVLHGSGIPSNDASAPPLSHSVLSSLAESSSQARQAQVSEIYRKLPLTFEENRGQVDRKVKFLSRGSGYTLLLSPTEAVLSLSAQRSKSEDRRDVRTMQPRPSRTRSTALRMKLVGANPSAQVAGLEELPGKINYVIGSDPEKWRTNIATYARVKYREVYPGIDLVYYGNQRQLEYDWILSAGAKPEAIRFAVEGASRITVDSTGDLVLTVAGGEVRLHKPVVYQETDGVRKEVAGGYVPSGNQEVGFRIAEYDTARPLVIDPVLSYSTYLGNDTDNDVNAIAIDSSGNVYLTGTIRPALGNEHVFVAKLNASGALIYFTHYGGNGGDFGGHIAVDSSGNAYVTGTTTSTDFPTANPFQPAFGGGSTDTFVTKFNSSGSAMFYSTYLGGTSSDSDGGIVVDSSGNAYVMGYTTSINFPTANPFDATYGGGLCGGFPFPSYPCRDVFVTKFNPSGSALVYSTYLGGSSDDVGTGGIAVDPSGNVYMTGYTQSTNFPTANPLQPAYAGSTDAFVTKFNSSASALVYSTYLGGSKDEIGYGIAVDSSGNAYVTGYTNSNNFPTANPVQPAKASGSDAFVTKVNPVGSALLYSSYHGGSDSDHGTGIAVDSSGSAYVTGHTTSTDFPLANPLQPAHGGGYDVLVTKFNPSGSVLLYSSYLGGSGSDQGRGIAVDSSNNVYVTGETNSTNFPTANPIQPANGGGYDAFLTKIGGLVPVFEITMSAATYVNGQTVAAPEFRLHNPLAGPIAVRLRVWLSVPGEGEFNLIDTGEDGSFFLPPGLNHNIGPLSLFQVTPSFPPKGNWQLNSRIEDPATGVLLSQDINPFVIQ